MLIDFTICTHHGKGASEQETHSVHQNATLAEALNELGTVFSTVADKFDNEFTTSVDVQVSITVDGDNHESENIRITDRNRDNAIEATRALLVRVWEKFSKTHLEKAQ